MSGDGTPGARRRERWIRASLLAASLLAFVAGGEFVTRLAVRGELHYTGWGPAYRAWFRTVHLDPLGLRCGTPGCPPPAPDPHAHTILVLGDSVAFGSGVEFEDAFPRRLEEILSRRGDAVRYRVVNVSAPGLDTGGERRLLDQMAPHVAPDLVLLAYFPNDAIPEGDPRLRPFISHFLGDGLGGWLYERSYFYYFLESRLHRLGERLRARPDYGEVLVRSYDPASPDLPRHLEDLAAVFRTVQLNGVDLVVVLFPVLHSLDPYPFAAAHALVREAAEGHGIPVIDLLPAFRGRDLESLVLSPYDSHPNAAGHAVAAQAIHDGLVRRGRVPPPDSDGG